MGKEQKKQKDDKTKSNPKVKLVPKQTPKQTTEPTTPLHIFFSFQCFYIYTSCQQPFVTHITEPTAPLINQHTHCIFIFQKMTEEHRKR